MHRIALTGLCALALAISPGCLTSTQATRLQTDLDEARRQIFTIQQDTAATRARVEEKSGRSGEAEAATGSQAQLHSLIQSLMDQIQALGEELRAMKGKMGTLQQELEAASTPSHRSSLAPVEATHGSPAPAVSAADASFKRSYADYARGSFDLAATGFEEFVKAWPEHPMAAEAQYWIGECRFSTQRYADAVEAFDRALARWPASEKVPASLLKKGMAQIEAGQSSLAVATLQLLIEKAPASDEARLAADRLRQMGLRGSR